MTLNELRDQSWNIMILQERVCGAPTELSRGGYSVKVKTSHLNSTEAKRIALIDNQNDLDKEIADFNKNVADAKKKLKASGYQRTALLDELLVMKHHTPKTISAIASTLHIGERTVSREKHKIERILCEK